MSEVAYAQSNPFAHPHVLTENADSHLPGLAEYAVQNEHHFYATGTPLYPVTLSSDPLVETSVVVMHDLGNGSRIIVSSIAPEGLLTATGFVPSATGKFCRTHSEEAS